MRIVILNRWFSERMGYADASLAHEYSMAGHEVFLVTSNAQPYFDSPDYCDIYEKFNGPPLTECCWKPHDNYTLDPAADLCMALQVQFSQSICHIEEDQAGYCTDF